MAPYIPLSQLKYTPPAGLPQYMGEKTKTPQDNVTKPTNTLPVNQVKTVSSPGSYKGVTITPGTDAQIQAQIKAIDSKQAPIASPTTNTTSTPTQTSNNITYNPTTKLYTTTAPTTTGTSTNTPTSNTSQNNTQVNSQASNQTNTQASNNTAGGVSSGVSAVPSQDLYRYLINQVVQRGTAGNDAISQRAQEIANTAGQQISDIGRQTQMARAGYLTTGTSPVAEGNAAVVAQTGAQQQQAVAQGAQMQLAGTQQGLTAQQQAQNALNQAAGFSAPVAGATFFGSPTSGGLVGGAQSGAVTGYTGNALIDASVDKAFQMIQSGKTSYNDAVATLAGNPIAQQALLARLGVGGGGTFSPTATNTAVSTNLAMGADYATQATDLSKNIDTFKLQGTKVIDFLQSTGINKSTGVWANSIINNLLANLNPAYKGIADQYFNELQVSTASILGRNSNLTPTTVSAMSNADLLKAMTPAELESYISYIDSLGQTSLGELQKKAGEAGGSQFYTGSQANPNIPTTLAPSGSLGQAFMQTTAGIIPQAIGAVTGFFRNIFH